MAIRDPKIANDGIYTLERGVHSGMNPVLLPRNQVWWAENCRFRGGFVHPRPGYIQRALTFEDAEDAASFTTGRFQGCWEYLAGQELSPRIIWSVAGQMWITDPTNAYLTQNITPDAGNNPLTSQAWGIQAEQFFILQDGKAAPMIYDGTLVKRSDFSRNQVPTGMVMAYVMGRLIVSKGRDFVVGDIVGGDSGTAPYNFSDALLYFTENDFLNEGGSFRFPINTGPITAMRALANLDTSLGQGPLLIFTRDAIASVNLPPDRATWKDVQYPIQTVAQINYGGLSQDSVVNVNGDAFYRSEDGIRSFVLARRQFFDWGNTPISHEMDRVILSDSIDLLKFASAIVFDNRMLMTCSPVPANGGAYFKGLISMDFEPLASMGGKSPPIYDGLWTGLNIYRVLTLDFGNFNRAFAATRNQVGAIELWEVTRNDRFDNQGTEDRAIQCVIETPSFAYPRYNKTPAPNLYRLEKADIFIDDIWGPANFTILYRSDQYNCWQTWHSLAEQCATYQQCTPDEGECYGVRSFRSQHRTRLMFPQPPDACDDTDNKPMRLGYEHQTRLEWSNARIKALRVMAYEVDEDIFKPC